MAKDVLTFNCIKSFISTRETRENDRVCVVLLFLFRKEARKKYHVVVVFVVSSSQNDVRSLSFFFLCLSRNVQSVSTVFKAARVGNILRPSVALKLSLSERKQRGSLFEIAKRTCSLRSLSSSNVAHSLFLLTQYRRPVRVDDAKT